MRHDGLLTVAQSHRAMADMHWGAIGKSFQSLFSVNMCNMANLVFDISDRNFSTRPLISRYLCNANIS